MEVTDRLDATRDVGWFSERKCRTVSSPSPTPAVEQGNGFWSQLTNNRGMCGRFAFFLSLGDAEDRFDAEAVVPITQRYNISPGSDIYSITNESPDEINELRWGLVPRWVDDPDDSPKPINARSETADSKPYFRDAFDKRRCLVLANGFYEWKAGGRQKTPYWVTMENDEPFAMAGLWESWSSNGDELRTVTILTTDANQAVEPIHDRMPVILEPDEERRWLEEDEPEERKELLRPLKPDLTQTAEISTRVNNPANDDPSVIEPVQSEQSGLGEFS